MKLQKGKPAMDGNSYYSFTMGMTASNQRMINMARISW
jgi:hypothetical protein